MLVLFIVLLTVALLVVGLVTFVAPWLRKLESKMTGPFRMLQTARLNLRVAPLPALADVDERTAAHLASMDGRWSALAQQGFLQLAQLHDPDGRYLIVGRHRDSNLLALLVRLPDRAPFTEFMLQSQDEAVHLITGEPGATDLQHAKLSVQAHAEPTVDGTLAAIAAMAALLPGRPLEVD